VLYLQVLIAVVLGIVIGGFFPELGKSLKPLGDGFIKLVKMMIAPIIFCTVVHGVASMSDMRKLGRVGVKTLVYFEVVSTLALVIGLIVVNAFKPGAGFDIDPKTLDPQIGKTYSQKAHSTDLVSFFLNIIPNTLFDAFVSGDLLQVLLVSGLTAFAIMLMGERREPVLNAIDSASHIFFGIMRIVVRLAPLGALGAMAFTVGSYGLGALNRLVALMAGFYLTAALFVFVVLGLIAAASGFSIFRFLAYIKEELLLVLGTSSSETALPGMLQKMRRLGCADATVGLVIPAGYSFNLDGSSLYQSLALLFIAQAAGVHLSIGQQAVMLLTLLVSSKGTAGVARASLVIVFAAAASFHLPTEPLFLLFAIDQLMDMGRTAVNVLGNCLACVVIARWEGEFPAETAAQR